MRELRFDKKIYVGEAVDEAVKALSGHGEFKLVEEDDAWVVEVTAKNAKFERRVAGELGNFALGLTIRSRR